MPDTTNTGGVSLLTLEDVMTYCNNFFECGHRTGDFTIADGTLSGAADFMQPGQYYRVTGSVFNNGVHRFGDTDDALTDETFSGDVYPLAPPRAFLALVEKIDAWRGKNEAMSKSPYTSENFEIYSYSKSSGRATDTGWQAQFMVELSRWRRL